MIQIQNDIPIPDRIRTGGKPATYPFRSMEIGDSFALDKSQADKLGWAARVWKQRHKGFDYVTRKTDNEIRLWRTK